ncbi:thrombospondin [Micromonospora carbonacea subsp. aurantiaca]|uniref:Thrombospondin n=1 Tax=Micromonospora carbonacea TaxID=47853 RepID=A0A7H8XW52_9ACTN|nr:thrombospondin [Micromonospora carbonacea]
MLSRRNEPATTYDSNGDGRVDERDGAVASGADGRPDGQPVVTDRGGEQTTYRSSATATDGERASDVERRAAERGALARAATARAATARTPDGELRRPATAAPTVDSPDPEREHGVTRTLPAAPTAAPATDRTAERPLPAERDRAAERPLPADRVEAGDEARREPVPVPAGPKPRASLLASLGLVVGVAGLAAVLTGTLAGYGIAVGALGAVLSVFGLLATRRRHIAGKTDALLGMAFGVAAVVLGVLAMTGQFVWPTTDGDWVQRLREWLDSQFVDRL